MRALRIVFLTAVVLVFGVCSSGAATLVVNPGDSIQAAINSASDGDVIKITAGTFNEQLTINGFTGLTIIGAGQGQTIISGSGLGAIDLIIITNSSKITFKGCTVDGFGVINNGFALAFGVNVTIFDCNVGNMVTAGISSLFSNRVTIKNCLLHNNVTDAVVIVGNYNSTVTSSVIENNGNGIHIFSCHNSLVVKNTISGNSAIGMNVENVQNTLVKQNSITGNGTRGILHSSFGTFGNLYLKNTIVDNLNIGVLVSAGLPTFSGNFISGNGVDGFSSEGGAYCTLAKNTISNNALGILMFNSSGFLSKNFITGNSSYGFQLAVLNTSSMMSDIITLTGNKVTDNGLGGMYSTDTTGECIQYASRNYLNSNSIGLLFSNGRGAFIDKNKVTMSVIAGIGSGNGAFPTMTKNLVYAGGHGIIGDDFAVIYKNKVYSNDGIGISGFNAAHLEGNVVQGNGLHGIDASGGNFSLIENCKVLGNGDGVTYFDLNDNAPPDDAWLNNKYGTSSW